VALDSRVCAGIKGKQEKNAAIPHSINAEVLASIRWAHEYEVLVVCLLVSLEGKRTRDYALKTWQLRMPNRKRRKDLKMPHSLD
jgi:hypothetical protein